MLLSDESDTALPQKDRFNFRSWGQPRARTSVAVSERAQQNDCRWPISQYMYYYETKRNLSGAFTKSRSRSPLAAFVRYTIALSVR